MCNKSPMLKAETSAVVVVVGSLVALLSSSDSDAVSVRPSVKTELIS